MQNALTSELESLQPASLDAGLFFGGKASGKLIQGYAAPMAYTPAINAEYIFHESEVLPENRTGVIATQPDEEKTHVQAKESCPRF